SRLSTQRKPAEKLPMAPAGAAVAPAGGSAGRLTSGAAQPASAAIASDSTERAKNREDGIVMAGPFVPWLSCRAFDAGSRKESAQVVCTIRALLCAALRLPLIGLLPASRRPVLPSTLGPLSMQVAM